MEPAREPVEDLDDSGGEEEIQAGEEAVAEADRVAGLDGRAPDDRADAIGRERARACLARPAG
jgi:hypothetical protein